MRLEHISVGRTKKLDIHGSDVETAYLKTAVEGPVEISSQGVAGNDVAVHTDAIYAIAAEHYTYWADRLGVDVSEWRPGHFAENLTISGLDEDDLCVGDIVSIGNVVELSVSGPRVPCFKLSWRMGQPDTFIKEFAVSGRTGVYFNVLKGGDIEAGDDVKVTRKASRSVPINDVAAYIFGQKPIDETTLENILALDGLSETSALFLRNMLYKIRDQDRLAKNRWSGWRPFTITKVSEETPLVKSYYLKPQDGAPVAPYRAGQFLTVNLKPQHEEALIRVWSISDYADKPEEYRISVKREAAGQGGSAYLHDVFEVGATLALKPPMGRFVLDRSSIKPVLLIAGGIGITPLLAMAKAHLDRGRKAPPVYIIHCCQNRASHPLRDEIDAMRDRYDVNTLYVYDRPAEQDEKGVDYDEGRYLSVARIAEFMKGCHIIHGGKRIEMPWFESDIYVCGPQAMQDSLIPALIEAGANPDRLFTELFSSGSDAPGTAAVDEADVFLARSQSSRRWRAEANMTLLELAESAGATPANACRMGVCQSCSTRLIEGDVHHQYSLAHPPEPGNVLLCCAVPASSKVIIDI